jgi:hypothetical protein
MDMVGVIYNFLIVYLLYPFSIDIVFDSEGYHSHSHSKEHSHDTITQTPRSMSPESSEGESTPGPSSK